MLIQHTSLKSHYHLLLSTRLRSILSLRSVKRIVHVMDLTPTNLDGSEQLRGYEHDLPVSRWPFEPVTEAAVRKALAAYRLEVVEAEEEELFCSCVGVDDSTAMIMCSNEDKCLRQWYHLRCIDLEVLLDEDGTSDSFFFFGAMINRRRGLVLWSLRAPRLRISWRRQTFFGDRPFRPSSPQTLASSTTLSAHQRTSQMQRSFQIITSQAHDVHHQSGISRCTRKRTLVGTFVPKYKTHDHFIVPHPCDARPTIHRLLFFYFNSKT